MNEINCNSCKHISARYEGITDGWASNRVFICTLNEKRLEGPPKKFVCSCFEPKWWRKLLGL